MVGVRRADRTPGRRRRDEHDHRPRATEPPRSSSATRRARWCCGPAAAAACSAGTPAPTASSGTILYCPRGGPSDMQGQAVFKIAVRAAVESSLATLERADMKPGDIDLFVPHQANQRITDAIASRLELGPERVVSTLADDRQLVRRHHPVLDVGRGRRRSARRRVDRAHVGLRRRHDVGDVAVPVDHVSRVALVTGANRGLGLALACDLAYGGVPRGRHLSHRAPRRRLDHLGPMRRRPTPSRSTPRSARSRKHSGPVEVLVSNAGHEPRHARAADVRRRLHVGGRRQPRRRVPGREACRAEDDPRPVRPHHLHLVGRRTDRPGRTGQLRRLEGGPRRPGEVAGAGSWPAATCA